MRNNCSVVVIVNQLCITWYTGASFGGLFTANRCAKCPSNMPDTRMLTNSKVLIYNGTELQFVQPVHLLPFSIGPISTSYMKLK